VIQLHTSIFAKHVYQYTSLDNALLQSIFTAEHGFLLCTSAILATSMAHTMLDHIYWMKTKTTDIDMKSFRPLCYLLDSTFTLNVVYVLVLNSSAHPAHMAALAGFFGSWNLWVLLGLTHM